MKSGIVTAGTRFFSTVRKGARRSTLLAAVIGLVVFSLAAAEPALAGGGSGVLLFGETFSNNTVPTSEVVLPELPSGSAQSPPDQACLTAGGTPSGASAVPQCPGASDPNGSGFLRFTTAADGQESGVFSATSLPSTQGLDVTFNSYQFGGGGADGIAFALAIANPADPQPPTEIGESGGSLGYAPSAGHNGLSLGYLGVGLDAYGNYSTTGPDGSDCSTQGDPGGPQTPQAVSVRGPGNAQNGYCLVGGPWANGNLDAGTATSVPVEVAINPTGSQITTASGLVVAGAHYAVAWTPVGGTEQTQTAALPDLTAAKYSDLGIPSSYYNSSGIPYQMTFGWVASTGSVTDNHEIRDVVVDSGTSSIAPILGLSGFDSGNGELGQGTSVGYTFTPSVTGANEAGTITFTDPFPTGLTPTSTAGTDPSWTCGIASATVTCTHAGVNADTPIPEIDIAVGVASNASTTTDALDDRGYVSANDALDADALDQGTAYGASTATSLSPSTGPMAGGTQVAVTGTNFDNVSSVNVGSATVSTVCSVNSPLTNCYTVNSATSITLYTPSGISAGGLGAQQVTVTNDVGTGSGSTYIYAKGPSTTTVASSQNPSDSGQAVAFTASLTSGATGTVTFTITPSHGSAVTCTGGDTVTVAASAATCSVPANVLSAAGSTYAVSANYNGDGNFLTSTGSLNPVQTVSQGPTTTSTPTSTVNPSVYGQSVTYATAVSSAAPGAGVPTGVAQFEETVGGITTTMCAGTLNGSGVTSCTSSVLPPAGIASVQATYLGDSNFLTSTSTGLTQFVDQASTSTVLSSNLNPSGFGKPVTFTATVSATAPGAGTPVGQVAFSSDGTPITGCSNVALNDSAQATCTTSSLSVAAHTVVAAYGGNANYLSSSGPLTQTVGQEVTTTSEVSSANPSLTGQSVTMTAHVSFTGSGTPTGNVTFTMTPTSGLAPQCSGGNIVALTGSASAVCSLVLSSTGGPYEIQAEYNGDANYDASGSPVLAQNVNADPTTTSVSTSAPNAVTDQSITFTASVVAVSPGGGVPSDGTVGFDIAGTPVGACVTQTVAAGTATCTVSNLDVAGGPTYPVTAFYSGAPDYTASDNSGSPLIQTIAPDATSTSVVSNNNPSTFGQSVTFTATMAANAPGGGTPTGIAVISADGVTVCTGLIAEGQLSCSTSTLAAGTHQIKGTYSASTNYRASVSSTLTQGVNQAATTTAVTSSDNPSTFGESVTITATVSPVPPGQGTPTGLVDFSNGIVPICVNVPLSGGVVTCAINYPIGSYTIVAAYRGSAGFAQSSNQLTQVVQKATTVTSVVSAPTVVTGQSATYQAETTVQAPGSTQLAPLTGTVSLYARDTQQDPQFLLCSTPVGLSSATVSCSSSAAVAAGSPWSITAVYSGDTNFTTSTSTPVAQTVNLAATTIGVTAVVNPAVTGQSILATAGFTIVSPGSDSPVAPTGTVEFEVSLDGGTSFNPVSGCEAQATSWSIPNHAGSASCTLPSPPALSSVELKGVYSGDTNFATSTSPPITVVVNEAATSTTVNVDTDPSVTGQNVNYAATVVVTPPGSDSTPPTGTVDFEYSTTSGITWNNLPGCAAQALTWHSVSHTGSAPCAAAFAATSSGAEVQSVYSGDGNFDGSTSGTPVTQIVNVAQTSESVALAPQSTVSGQTVTATATLLITAPGSDSQGPPTGAVVFQYSTNGGSNWTDIPRCDTQPLTWDSVSHNGTASCATGFDSVSSPVEIQAIYSGDLNFALSTSPSATDTVTQAATTTSVIAVPAVSVSGQAVGLSASVSVPAPGSDSPAGPSGTVDFESSANEGGTWSDISGCATRTLTWSSTSHTGSAPCTTAFSALSSGIEIQAIYSGDTNFTSSTSTPASQTVNLASTGTVVTAVVNPSVTGQSITATAALTIASPGSDSPVTPTGAVEFEISLDGGGTFNPVSGCGSQAMSWDAETHAGSSACTLLSPNAVSSVELEGIYSGDVNFATSTSPPFTQVVNEASTSTSIDVDTNPSVSGEPVNYTATVVVTPPGSDSTTPTGAVDFQYSTTGGDSWNDISGCTTQEMAWDSGSHTGTSTCATDFAASSSGDKVRAVYSGDSNFGGSISSVPVTQVVNAAQTTSSVVLSSASSVSGQGITANATLLIAVPGADIPGAPTGSVVFQYSANGGTWSDISGCATQPLTWHSSGHTGSASCAASFDAGSSPVQVRAAYSGDRNFAMSTSPSATETVDEVSTTTSVIETPGVSVSGQSIVLGASVSISSPGSDVPAGASGPVDFEYTTNGGGAWNEISGCATQDIVWNSTTHIGAAACTTAFLAASSGVEMRAVYLGDQSFTGSSSSTVTQTVNPASTVTGVDTSANPSVNGQMVTVDAAVNVGSPGGDAASGPTGTVEFESSTNHGGTWAPVAACSAQVLVWSDSLHHGTSGCTGQFAVSQSGIEFKAVYSGDSNFTTSVSGPVTQTVERSLTSTAVTSTPDSSGPLQPVTFTAKVSVLAPGTGSLSGTVAFRDGASTLCAAVALSASGSASCTSHLSIAAAQSVVAAYSGNSLSAGSSGSMVQDVRHGYWLLGADGGVFSYGDAQFYGSLPQIGYTPAGSGGPHQLKAPLVGIVSTVSGNGYWLVASDGGVFSFGDAVFHGSTGAIHLNKPIVSMAVTPDGRGYWLVASDGGVFSFGDAVFHGSTGAIHLNKPIVSMAVTPDGKGYWLVASDGGVFAFGDARYHGSPSTGSTPDPIVGLVRTFDGGGYWIAGSGGHVDSYGDAGPVRENAPTNSPVVGMGGTADGRGYWMSTASGGVFTFGDAIFDGSASGIVLQRPIVGMSGI